MNKKSILITTLITIIVFSILGFLIYSIYCYGYYDKHEEEIYVEKFNKKDYTFIYDHLLKDNSLSLKDYQNATNLALNRTNAEEIYNLYYSKIYDKETFLNLYYYGTYINKDNIEFYSTGKTTYFKKRSLYYKYITLQNDKNYTKIGVLSNISFTIEPNSILYLDNDLLCEELICTIDKIYGGIHSVKYVSNNYEYYGLININEDNLTISIPHIESLVKINTLEKNSSAEK